MAVFQNSITIVMLFIYSCAGEILNDDEFKESRTFKEQTVYIAILIRNKEHTLPYFFTCLERLDYPKERITLWLRSDHNEDSSADIINTWLSNWARYYHSVDSEIKTSPPYHLPGEVGPAHWPQSRHSHMINLREQALDAARHSWADYIWFLDSDVFITNPNSLKVLISKDYTITAPMLRSDGLYSNFWCGMTDEFYYVRTEDYEPILNRKHTGCFNVPMVHSSVLVDLRTHKSDTLSFVPAKVSGYSGPHDDIITFALAANLSGVPLFVCNEQIYGYVMVPLEKTDNLSYDKLQLTNLKLEVMVESPPLPVSDLLSLWVMKPIPDTLGVDTVFMINLQRRPERRKHMQECFAELGVDAVVMDAVDGKLLSDKQLGELGVKLMTGYKDPYHKRPMKRGEIGCFLSHYNVWKQVVEQRLQTVMVLEDDVRFVSFFRQKVETILHEIADLNLEWDLIYLGRKRLQESEETILPGSRYLVRPNYSYWTLGYLLSASGAQKLLDSKPLENLLPVDEFLPILYDRHPESSWKAHFPKRDLEAFSAEPLLIYPTRYLHEEGYISDTEDSPPIETKLKEDL